MDWGSIAVAVLGSGLLTAILNFWFEHLRSKREIEKQKLIRMNEERMALYKQVVDTFAECVSLIEGAILSGNASNFLNTLQGQKFNETRMKTYGYLCIYGDQKAIDAHEDLVSYIFDVCEGHKQGDWKDMREIAMKLLNSFRKDFDPENKNVQYHGDR